LELEKKVDQHLEEIEDIVEPFKHFDRSKIIKSDIETAENSMRETQKVIQEFQDMYKEALVDDPTLFVAGLKFSNGESELLQRYMSNVIRKQKV
jgi:uncharacterized protein YjgD (DUF1641 family)